MSEVRGRLEKNIPDKYDNSFKDIYRNQIKKLLSVIDDDIIIHEVHLNAERRLYALRLKYNEELEKHLHIRNNAIWFDELKVFGFEELVRIRSVLAIEDVAIITGFVSCPIGFGSIDIDVKSSIDTKMEVFISSLAESNESYCLNEKVYTGESFRICLPYVEGESLSIYAKVGDNTFKQNLKLLEDHTVNDILFALRENHILMTGKNSNKFPTYYLFPYESVNPESRICIYGAGYIGRQYLEQMKMSRYCQVVAVADKSFENETFYDKETVFTHPSRLDKFDYDHLVVAIGRREMAAEVIDELNEMGIPKDKIVLKLNRMIPWA